MSTMINNACKTDRALFDNFIARFRVSGPLVDVKCLRGTDETPFYNISKPRPIYIYELHSKIPDNLYEFQHQGESNQTQKPSHPIYISSHHTTAPSQQPKQITSLNSKNPSSSPPANSHAGAYSPASPAPRKHNNTPSH
jgi:hypothetical protein